MVALLIIVFYCINQFLNWNNILNTSGISESKLSHLVTIIFSFFCLQFVLQLITTVLTANHEPAKASIVSLLGNVLTLIIILIANQFIHSNLLILGLVLGGSPVLISLIATILLYKTTYRQYAPSFRHVRFKYAKKIMNLGVKFFFIQIAFIILYQTSNVIIIKKFGPAEVTIYNIAYKYFLIVPMIFNLITAPLWSSYTDAWTRNDLFWIKQTFKRLHVFFLLLVLVCLMMVYVSDYFYSKWIGEKILIPLNLSISMAFYVLINVWNGIYSQFLNGIGKIKTQLFIAIIASIINIPLALLLCEKFGAIGTVFSTCIVSLLTAVILPLQYKKIMYESNLFDVLKNK